MNAALGGQESAPENALPRHRRIVLLDALRGAAIVAMIGYHIGWDLFYFRILEVDITADPVWIATQLSILGSFVVLAGASLVLAHGDGIRWRPLWRREAVLVGAAIAVSLGTYVAFSEYFAFFGVLHAIALFSLLALPLLRAPLWLVALVAAVVIVVPFLWQDPAFLSPWLAWIGFWPVQPPTVDLVPVFPWFGVALLGVLAVRLLRSLRTWPALVAWRGGPIARTLAFAGRWSLLIYLLHQPLIYGAMSGIVSLLPPPPEPVALTDAEDFSLSCQSSCADSGSPAPYCTAYCQCTLEGIERDNLWDVIGAEVQSEADEAQTTQLIKLCQAMAEGPPPHSSPSP